MLSLNITLIINIMDDCNLQESFLICPICRKKIVSKRLKTALAKHLIWCNAKHDFLDKYSFNKESLETSLNECGSVLQFQIKYPFRTNFTFYYKLFKDFDIDTSIKKAANSINVKNKREATNLALYGENHNFCKNHPSRKKWEAELLANEGITNVFQRLDVKQKSIQTLNLKYGVDHIAQHKDYKVTLDTYIKKFGETEGTIKYKELCYNKGKLNRLLYYIELFGETEGLLKYQAKKKQNIYNLTKKNKISGLNIIFAKILDELQIQYEQEFLIIDDEYYRYYDFKINNVLIELNGDFWHANPLKYQEYDILHFPGKDVIAKDIWEKDKLKKEIAIKNGYSIFYFWEHEFLTKQGLDIIKLKINDIFKSNKN